MVAPPTTSLNEKVGYLYPESSQVERNRLSLGLLLIPFEILLFSADAGLAYGRVREQRDHFVQVIGAYEMLIASHAMAEGLTLVTNNSAQFSRIKGLFVENWITGR